jgi:hypothetical protein
VTDPAQDVGDTSPPVSRWKLVHPAGDPGSAPPGSSTMPSRLMNSLTTIRPTSVVPSRLTRDRTSCTRLGGRRSLRQLASSPGDESFGLRCAGGYGGLQSEGASVAAHDFVRERVDVGVGVFDDVSGYLNIDAGRGAEIPGVNVHGDRQIIRNSLAQRSLYRPGQVGVAEDISGLPDDGTPELSRVTFDKIARSGHVRPRGPPTLHDAHPDPHRSRKMTEQITSGPTSTRRWSLPVIGAEPNDDTGEEVESPIQEFSGPAAHRSPPNVSFQTSPTPCDVPGAGCFARNGIQHENTAAGVPTVRPERTVHDHSAADPPKKTSATARCKQGIDNQTEAGAAPPCTLSDWIDPDTASRSEAEPTVLQTGRAVLSHRLPTANTDRQPVVSISTPWAQAGFLTAQSHSRPRSTGVSKCGICICGFGVRVRGGAPPHRKAATRHDAGSGASLVGVDVRLPPRSTPTLTPMLGCVGRPIDVDGCIPGGPINVDRSCSTLVTTREQALVRVAARNNAQWCAAMSCAHGVFGEFGRQAWTAQARTPLFYPDAVTLVPGADPGALLARIDTATPGASVKDSFADLGLTHAGFTKLFEAQWIHRPARTAAPASDLTWDVVRDQNTLRAWAITWDNGNANLFRPALLDDPDTFVLVGRATGGQVVAGAVACHSDEVVGLSNVFALDGPDAAWPAVLSATNALFPSLPVVGYERGDDLAAAARLGFEPVGPLRIWLHDT